MTQVNCFITELEKQCKDRNLDYNSILTNIVDVLGTDNPEIFLFGIGIHPDNPNTLLDVMIVHDKLILSCEILNNESHYDFFPLSKISRIRYHRLKNTIKIFIEINLGIGYFLINETSQESNFKEFFIKLKILISNLIEN